MFDLHKIYVMMTVYDKFAYLPKREIDCVRNGGVIWAQEIS